MGNKEINSLEPTQALDTYIKFHVVRVAEGGS